MRFSRPVLFRAARVLAVVVLGVLGVVASGNSVGMGVAAGLCGVAVVVLEVGSARWEGRSANPLGAKHDAVLGRAMTLIADLAQLAGREYDLWVVDLYLPKYELLAWSPSRSGTLGLAVHLALTDTRSVPNQLDVDDSLIGSVFSECRPAHWWDETLASSADENRWWGLDEKSRERFRDEEYGVMSAFPVVSSLGTDCCGVLVVHVRRDVEAATKALSVLRQEEGKRRVAAACRDMFNQLRSA